MITASYASITAVTWLLFLVTLSIRIGLFAQAAVVVVFLISIIRQDHLDTRLLPTIVCLSERCLLGSTSTGHTPILLHASALAAYVDTLSGVYERGAVVIVAATSIWGLTRHIPSSSGFFIFVLVYDYIQRRLLARIGRSESFVVAFVGAYYASDIITNRRVDSKAMTLSSFPHIASTSFAVATMIFIVLWIGQRRRSLWYFLLGLLAALCAATMHAWVVFGENPFVWLMAFFIGSRLRMYAVAIWAAVIPVVVLVIDVWGTSLTPALRRKLFHVLAVVLFAPVTVIDSDLMALASVVATGMGCVLECARNGGIPTVTRWITPFLSRHVDHREDAEGTVRSHLYLIGAFGVPLDFFMRSEYILSRPLSPAMRVGVLLMPGVLSLGIVDTAASAVGLWRRRVATSLKLRRGRKQNNSDSPRKPAAIACALFPVSCNPSLAHKSVCGTLGGIFVGVATWVAFATIFLGVRSVRVMVPTSVACIVVGWWELVSSGVDNAELPWVGLAAVQTVIAIMTAF